MTKIQQFVRCTIHGKLVRFYVNVAWYSSKQSFTCCALLSGQKCFKFVFLDITNGVDWNEAVKRCRVPGRKSDIASVHGPYEHGDCPSRGHITMTYNERGGVSNHQPYDCLLKRLFGRRSNKPSKLRVQSSASLAFLRGIQRWPVNSPHKGPVTRKMFPFDDVIMKSCDIMVITSIASLTKQLNDQLSIYLHEVTYDWQKCATRHTTGSGKLPMNVILCLSSVS